MNTNEEEKMTPDNYDPTYTGRYHCVDCGYITVNEIDFESRYLDLHCKCGAPVVRVPSEEIDLFDTEVVA